MHEFALYGKRHFSLANYKSQCVSMLTQPVLARFTSLNP